ncbi:unnamed protein product [Didymodactylos carnosus]|uniref:Uncharacterized protein n=1 Tax=Didymodactylos carnosus TaxID=1234261 RepID=A0A815E9T3_9BILA|nr:unnamed protein product [Didymodactylos carnosus]CAF1571485.1 unnamed protein product [Didymodactylos carnosus]CAF4143766.1 unnamed protein product [Didymodactylos carnosus]CAF4366366.1 unnamed protein product [Didymodactylos carnosus]
MMPSAGRQEFNVYQTGNTATTPSSTVDNSVNQTLDAEKLQKQTLEAIAQANTDNKSSSVPSTIKEETKQ